MAKKLRRVILLLTVVVTAFTAIGMARMPVRAALDVLRSEAVAETGGHHHDSKQSHGGDECLYCLLAKATDLPAQQEAAKVYRRPLPDTVTVQLESCHLPEWTVPCLPRAPPRPDTV